MAIPQRVSLRSRAAVSNALHSFLLFSLVGLAITITNFHFYDLNDVYYSASESITLALYKTRAHVYSLARLADLGVEILIFLALVSLSAGITFARLGEHTKISKLTKFISYGIAAVLTVLAVTNFGLVIKLNVAQYGDFLTGRLDLASLAKSIRSLSLAIVVLMFVLSIATVGLSVMTKLQSRSEPRLQTVRSRLRIVITCG